MILITCALKHEAKPLIEAFKLNHLREIGEYKIYKHEDLYLIITGVGKVKSAIATGFFIGKIAKPDFAINFGICGSSTATLTVGSALLANKIYDEGNGRSYFPKNRVLHNFKETTLHTYEKPVTFKLMEPVIVDMEGSGFFQSANKFLDDDKIFCIKVVSDHLDVERLDPIFINEILKNNVENVKAFIGNLQEEKKALKGLSTIDRLNLKRVDE